MSTETVGMCTTGTPVEHHEQYGLWVKREDQCCPGGPNFSKTRGVYAHVAGRLERVIGVLDTGHSQGGWAVARACQLLDRRCILYYPEYKVARQLPYQQRMARELGAILVPLKAGMSAVLFNIAKQQLRIHPDSYMMPNALKLPEMVVETVAEVGRTLMPPVSTVVISASSGTIAAGVLRGLEAGAWGGTVVIHQGYSRPISAMDAYIRKMADASLNRIRMEFVDEGYSYGQHAKPCTVGHNGRPPWLCNEFYDLKVWSWWHRVGRATYGDALMWNIG